MSTGIAREPLAVAIVGSGPSGFYAAEALLKSRPDVQIDMYEYLPVPYGLVRNGVAPDHPKLKQAIRVYARIAESPGFHFLGHVRVGSDVSVDDLRSIYHAVVICCGAQTDRKLGIPGEHMPGSHTGTEFVGWYNGHPDYRDCTFDLATDVAVIVGQGNVAADICRILARDPRELRHTDIAEHALEVLSRSRIREIYVVGRRGPAQAKFTAKELREFGDLDGCVACAEPDELRLNSASQNELNDKHGIAKQKVYQLFEQFAQRASTPGLKRVHFTFLKSPVALLGDGRVERIRLELNALEGEPFRQRARGTGKYIELETGLVFRSIGYRGSPIPGLPFDEARGVIPSQDGRVLENGRTMPGMYVAGWIKRGPVGIIGTNRADSVATVNALLEDLEQIVTGGHRPGHPAALELLQRQGVQFVHFDDWKKIDKAEIHRGEPTRKPREKFTCIEEMMDVLGDGM